MNIGARLKSIRTMKKHTQKEVAEYLNISTVSYSRYEQNVRQPDLDTLSKLAKYYDVGADYFFDDLYYYKDLNDEFNDEFYGYEVDEEYYMLQSALSKKLEIEKKARKLISRVDSIFDEDEKPDNRELAFIKKKLGELFVENKNIDEMIEMFGGFADVEDAIIDCLSKLQ